MRSDRVAAASQAWVWVPATAVRVETRDYLLVRFPDHFERHLVLLDLRALPTEETVGEVLARARGFDLPELSWWVKLGAPPETDAVLVGRGGVLEETLDVLALDLASGLPDVGPLPGDRPGGVELRWTTDLDTLRDAYRVLEEVFGGSVPPDQRLRLDSEHVARDLADGRGGGVVAYADGGPVGTGGITLADRVARLWSGSVLATQRGRGIYRALLAARLGYAVEHSATMALVKGRVETSGPILRRIGFSAHGQERCYRIPL